MLIHPRLQSTFSRLGRDAVAEFEQLDGLRQSGAVTAEEFERLTK